MKKATILFCIIFFLFTACQRKKEKIAHPIPMEMQTLTLGMTSTLEGLPFYVAQQQGFYDSLGLNLNILRFHSSADRDAAFIAKQTDGMITDYPSAIMLQAVHHINLGLIFQNDGYCCFITSKESGINQLQQLKEKNIAISRNTIIEYATDQLLHKSGIKQTDVNLPSIGQIPLRLQMLQYNQIDASFLPEPTASIAMNSGHRSLISTQELDINFSTTAFCRKIINEKREEITLLITGYNLGVDYIKSHSQNDLKLLLVELGVPEKLTGMIALPDYRKAERPSPETLEKATVWLKSLGRIPETYQTSELIDTTYIQKNRI